MAVNHPDGGSNPPQDVIFSFLRLIKIYFLLYKYSMRLPCKPKSSTGSLAITGMPFDDPCINLRFVNLGKEV